MSGMTREEAIVVIWNRCQHCKETEEAIKALKEQMICPIFSDDEVKQPCIKSPCGFERPHGEWIIDEFTVKEEDDNVTWYHCSECFAMEKMDGSKWIPYCWHCGAKMQKEGDEE